MYRRSAPGGTRRRGRRVLRLVGHGSFATGLARSLSMARIAGPRRPACPGAARAYVVPCRCALSTASPRPAGLSATTMPASFIASILSSASPLPPATMAPGVAHAAARGRGAAGDEAGGGLPAALLRLVLEELRGLLLGRAADLADHDDRLGLGVGEEPFQHVDVLRALDRVAADADAGRLAEAHVGGLLDRLVGERARARHNARPSRACGCEPGMMPILQSSGRDDAGAVRADEDRVGCPASARLTFIMSRTGMPSVMQTTRGSSASMASRIESAAKGGGT